MSGAIYPDVIGHHKPVPAMPGKWNHSTQHDKAEQQRHGRFRNGINTQKQ
jgi:hypothetical protein